MCSSEDKKRGRGQSKGRSQKAKACKKGREEEKVEVCLLTPEQSASGGHCFIGEC